MLSCAFIFALYSSLVLNKVIIVVVELIVEYLRQQIQGCCLYYAFDSRVIPHPVGQDDSQEQQLAPVFLHAISSCFSSSDSWIF